MNENDVLNLFDRYREGKCTPDEIARVESWFLQHSNTSSLPDIVPDFESVGKEIWENVGVRHHRKRYIPILQYAAAILLVVGVSFILFKQTSHKKQIAFDLQPGGNIAVLTLANGKTIDLKDIQTGTVATVSGVVVTSLSNGTVTYQTQTGSKTATENNHIKPKQKDLNTITTPRGGQFTLILPDGSSVLLNASSSLQFPSRFVANQRQVTLVGEAYFEVTKNAKQPFVVRTKGQELTVLGTHFNISAYPDETVKTTLSQGSVQLSNSSSLQKTRLKPEQQAVLTSNGFDIKEVNSANEMAWKRGLFIFRQTPLREALQQIERWYNVEVDYSNLPNVPLDAGLTRSLTLNRLIQILDENADLKFKLYGRRLVYVGK